MALCRYCGRDMTVASTTTCKGNRLVRFPDGTEMSSVPYVPPAGQSNRCCGDCNVVPGGFHHPGCDLERCPKCGGQRISCGCEDEPAPTKGGG